MEEVWYKTLEKISDEDGTAAFGALMRETIFGDLEPAHVIEKANDMRALKMLEGDADHPWISTAPKFRGDGSPHDPTPEFISWQKRESRKFYRSVDGNGDIFLIRNPAAWAWTTDARGSVRLVRPAPQPTGEKLQKPKGGASKWSPGHI